MAHTWSRRAQLKGLRSLSPARARHGEYRLAVSGVGCIGSLCRRRCRSKAFGLTVLNGSKRERIYSLSAPEREVVRLRRRGRSYATIEGELRVGESTVRTFVRRAYRKLDVQARYELPPLSPCAVSSMSEQHGGRLTRTYTVTLSSTPVPGLTETSWTPSRARSSRTPPSPAPLRERGSKRIAPAAS